MPRDRTLTRASRVQGFNPLNEMSIQGVETNFRGGGKQPTIN